MSGFRKHSLFIRMYFVRADRLNIAECQLLELSLDGVCKMPTKVPLNDVNECTSYQPPQHHHYSLCSLGDVTCSCCPAMQNPKLWRAVISVLVSRGRETSDVISGERSQQQAEYSSEAPRGLRGRLRHVANLWGTTCGSE